MRKIIGLALSGVVFYAVAAPAAEHASAPIAPPAQHQEQNKPHRPMMDKDHNGTVSKQEFLSHSEERFAKMDKNHDGQISPDERPQRAKRGGEHRQQGEHKGERMPHQGDMKGDKPMAPPPPAEAPDMHHMDMPQKH